MLICSFCRKVIKNRWMSGNTKWRNCCFGRDWPDGRKTMYVTPTKRWDPLIVHACPSWSPFCLTNLQRRPFQIARQNVHAFTFPPFRMCNCRLHLSNHWQDYLAPSACRSNRSMFNAVSLLHKEGNCQIVLVELGSCHHLNDVLLGNIFAQWSDVH